MPDQMDEEEAPNNHKPSKRGLIYLSSIPPYMNVTTVREVFGQFGKVGRVYLQLLDKGESKKKKHKVNKKFTEGWVEFEKKCVAKRVATLLNNTQVSTRKKSKHYDYRWNIKYLSNFKWTHLHERLAYERAEKAKQFRNEVQLSKKKTNFFSVNIGKKGEVVNKEYDDMENIATGTAIDVEEEQQGTRETFLQSLL